MIIIIDNKNIMKKTLLIYITILITLSASAQYEAQWTNTLTNTWNVNITSISAFGKESLICGTFQDSIVINNTKLISEGGKDVFLLQTDSIGQIINSICFGGNCNDTPINVVTKENTFIIAGMTSCPEKEGEIFIKSFDFDGNLKHELSVPFIGDIRLGMLKETDSIIYIGGSLKGQIISDEFEIISEDNEHSFIVGLSDKGKYITSWQSTGLGRHRLRCVDVIGDKCTAIVSVSSGTFISDTLPCALFDKDGVVMLSLDKQLKTKWLVSAECDGFSEAADLSSTTEGILFGINFNGNLTTEDSTFVSYGNLSSYVAKYNYDGKLIWHNTLGGAYCRLSDVVSTDSLDICTGCYRGFMETNGDTIGRSSVRKAFLVSYDDKGRVLWNADMETNNNSYGKTMSYDGERITLCSSILQVKSRNAGGMINLFDINKRNTISRYVITDKLIETETESNEGDQSVSDNHNIDDINNLLDDFSISVFPNPSKNIINWSVCNGNLTSIEVYDIRGFKIETQSCEKRTSGQIDISAFPVGIYILCLTSYDGVHYYEIIKN